MCARRDSRVGPMRCYKNQTEGFCHTINVSLSSFFTPIIMVENDPRWCISERLLTIGRVPLREAHVVSLINSIGSLGYFSERVFQNFTNVQLYRYLKWPNISQMDLTICIDPKTGSSLEG